MTAPTWPGRARVRCCTITRWPVGHTQCGRNGGHASVRRMSFGGQAPHRTYDATPVRAGPRLSTCGEPTEIKAITLRSVCIQPLFFLSRWRWAATEGGSSGQSTGSIVMPVPPGTRDYAVHLPVWVPVDALSIGRCKSSEVKQMWVVFLISSARLHVLRAHVGRLRADERTKSK